jgi:tRNA(Ile)-lysidine synthase
MEVSETDERPVCLAMDSSRAIFDRELLQDLHVRAFRNGDRFMPLGMKELVKLKDFFISRKIPRHERRRIPLLLSGKDIIWVIGQRIDERYKVTGDSCHFLRVRAEGQGLSTPHNLPLTTAP